jgi:precorrin-3B synthase
MNAPSLIKGWCPGALRPMESGDGLLVRLRITGGILSAPKAHIIAKAAMQHGNGLIDLTGRANLQIRGVGASQWPHLIADLSRHGLIDQDAEAESVRNVMASPLAGIDPSALLDIRPIVQALEARLVSDTTLHALPGKFGFLIDDGSRFGVSGLSTDIGFEAVKHGDETLFAVRLGNTETVALITPDQVADCAAAIALTFIKTSANADKPLKRIKDLISLIGIEALLQKAGLSRLISLPFKPVAVPPLGFHALDHTGFVGIGAPFGRWSANSLAALADIAAKDGTGELRLTPWRAILVSGLDAKAANALIEQAGREFITKANDPRLAISACAGMHACRNATVNTHEDALAFAALPSLVGSSRMRLHVSGCEKGCANPAATTAVLVGKNGLYDLVVNGKASDTPHLFGLNRAAAEAALKDLFMGARS